tara:strand:+ start:2197 stop:3357 length:1161 start_codon:yes stop_codon:yes gene_type:complete
MNSAFEELVKRREQVEAAWNHYIAKSGSPAAVVQDIETSWQRSLCQLAPQGRSAPLRDPGEAGDYWQNSVVRQCAFQEISQLKELARDSECVAAISDPAGRLVWTHASYHMRELAEEVNFVAGGDWRESSAGTNAVGLCLSSRKPVTVFSAEHYRSSLHDWVCYAAPIVHPSTARLVGVLDLSSSWDRYTPLGRSAIAGMAQAIAKRLPDVDSSHGLSIDFLGQPRVIWQGKQIALSLRHCEILCLLALHPEGLSLDALHSALYGDQQVTRATLRSEVSTLRSRLGGCIASRPYRLVTTVTADFLELWQALSERRLEAALERYRDALLPASNSPEISEWRYCIDALMSDKLASLGESQPLLQHPGGCRSTLVRERLAELLERAHDA